MMDYLAAHSGISGCAHPQKVITQIHSFIESIFEKKKKVYLRAGSRGTAEDKATIIV